MPSLSLVIACHALSLAHNAAVSTLRALMLQIFKVGAPTAKDRRT